jgi:hypothetical protein
MYYNRGNQPNLPFDPTQPDQRNLIQQRPNLPNFDLGGLYEFGGNLIDNLIVQIQDNAGRNNLRNFAFNFWSQNVNQGPFVNNQFIELIQLFGLWVETVLMQLPQNVDVIAVIQNEAPPFVDAASAHLADMYPDLRQFLPPEADQQLHQHLNNWRKIERDIHAVRRSYQQNQPGYGGGLARGGSGFNRSTMGGQGGGYQQRTNVNPNALRPSWEQNNVQTPGPAPVRRGFNNSAPANPGNTPNRPSDGSIGAMKQNTSSSGYKSLRQAVQSNMEPDSPAPQQVNRPTNAPVQAAAAPTPVADRPFDCVPLGDGSYLTPAYQTEKTPKYSLNMVPQVFNRDDYILFYLVKPDGKMIETVQKKSDIQKENATVDYLEHEMDERLRKLYKTNLSVGNREVVVPHLKELRRLVPDKTGTVAVKVNEKERLELDRANAPRQLATPIQASDIGIALFKAAMERDRMGLEDGKDFLEFIIEEIHENQTYPKALELLLALGRCQTYTEFLALLDNQNRNDPHMTPELYQHINRRMTETFNRFLDKQLYMGLEIDDFVDDWPQFPSFCTKKFGELMTEKVEGSAKEVIARAVSVLHGDGLTKHLHTLSEAERAALDKPAVFCDRYSVTQMPWTMYEMDSHWRLEGVLSEDSGAKPFHEALTSLFARTKTNGVHVRVLLTADGREIYVSQSSITDGDFMVTKEPPGFLTEFLTRKAAL